MVASRQPACKAATHLVKNKPLQRAGEILGQLELVSLALLVLFPVGANAVPVHPEVLVSVQSGVLVEKAWKFIFQFMMVNCNEIVIVTITKCVHDLMCNLAPPDAVGHDVDPVDRVGLASQGRSVPIVLVTKADVRIRVDVGFDMRDQPETNCMVMF